MIRVEVDAGRAREGLRRAATLLRSPRRVLRAGATTLLTIILGTFSRHGASYRPKPWPPKADGTEATLKKTGTLSSSFWLQVGQTEARISNPMPYAAIHQFGGRTPARTITPHNARALRFKIGEHTVFARRVNHPGSNIPARPFVPITGDKLTPEAEALVTSAMLRALQKQIGAK